MPRRVRTAAGAEFYGQPIGTVITKDMIEAARARVRAAASGRLRPKSRSGSGSSGPAPGGPSSTGPSGGVAPSGPSRPGIYQGTGKIRYRLHQDGAVSAYRGPKRLVLPESVENEVRADIIDGRLAPVKADYLSSTGMRYTVDGDQIRAHGPDGKEYRVPSGVEEMVRDDIFSGKLTETSQPKQPERAPQPSLLEGKTFTLLPPKVEEPDAGDGNVPKLKKSANETVWAADQDGSRYVFKPSRRGSEERAHIELLGHELAHLWGYETARADIVTIDGRTGLIQEALENTGDLEKFDFSQTTPLMAEGLGAEQVLDWMLDNDDSHRENFLVRRDGSLVGIDKGRTYRHFGAWDGLSTTETANSNTEDLAYTEFFNAVRAGQVSREVVEAGAAAAIKRAQEIESTNDILISAMIEARMKFRRDWRKPRYVTWWDGEVPTSTQGLTQAVLERKRNLVKDITAMWDRVRMEIPTSQP